MSTILSIRLVPNARKTAYEGIMDDGETLRIRLQAPPVEGKANAALRKWLARTLKVPQNAVELISGEKSRDKRVRVEGHSREEILALLAGLGD